MQFGNKPPYRVLGGHQNTSSTANGNSVRYLGVKPTVASNLFSNANQTANQNTRFSQEILPPKPQPRKEVNIMSQFGEPISKKQIEKNQNISSPHTNQYLKRQVEKKKEVEKPVNFMQQSPMKSSQVQKKKEESFSQNISNPNRDGILEIYVKQALESILPKKINPGFNSLKNYSPRLYDAFTQFNKKYSDQKRKYEQFEKKLKDDILSHIKGKNEREGRSFYENDEKTKLQQYSLERAYEEIKKLLQEKAILSNSPNRKETERKEQFAKIDALLKDTENKFEKGKAEWSKQLKEKQQTIIKFRKDLAISQEESKRLTEELAKGNDKNNYSIGKGQVQLYNQTVELKKQNNKMKIQLQGFNSFKPIDMTNLREAKLRSEKEADVLRLDNKNLKNEINLHKNEFEKVKNLNLTLQNSSRKSQAKIAQLLNDLNGLKSKLDEYSKTKIRMEEDIDKLKKQVERYRSECERLAKLTESLIIKNQQEKRRFEDQQRKNNLVLRVRVLEADLEKANRTIAQLRESEKANQLKLAQTTKSKELIKEQLDNACFKITTLEIDLDSVHKQSQPEKELLLKNLRNKTDEIQRLNNLHKVALSKNEESRQAYSALQKKMQQLTTLNQQMMNENKRMVSDRNGLQDALRKKQKQISQPNSIASRYVDNGREAETRRLKQLIDQKDREIKQKNDLIKAKDSHIEQLQNKLLEATEELMSAQKESELIQSKLHHMERTQPKLSAPAAMTKNEKERLEQRLKQKNNQIDDLTSQIASLNQILQERYDVKNDSLHVSPSRDRQDELRISQLQSTVERLTKQLQSQQNQLFQLNQALIEKQKINQELRRISEAPNPKLNNYIKELQSENNKLKLQLRSLEQSIKRSKPANSSSQTERINLLYQHLLLDEIIEYKQFLTQSLESHFNSKIKKTKLIYYYDKLNRVNFHKYIDSMHNLLVIVKSDRGAYTAGFSKGGFWPNQPSDSDGLLISLTNKKVFTLATQNQRAITYDDYYIIFGNSQLRIKSQENELFSNFGISNSFYATRGERVSVLLGGGPSQRQVSLDNYEIYQVIFQ